MSEPVVFIPLTKGHVTVIDFDDFDKVRGHKWCASVHGQRVYAARNVRLPDGRRRLRLMHNILMPQESRIDHKDGDGLNNRRQNLRPATHQQNLQGFQRKKRGSKSKFRGVSWNAFGARWMARITINGELRYLGRFHSEEEAARAYDTAARKHFGEFASPNFL